MKHAISFRDGPYLRKGKQSLGLDTDEDIESVQERRGESFPSARRRLVNELKKSLEGRFECEGIIQAMSISNFKSWPRKSDDNHTEITGYRIIVCS